jgi:hypothetical protein
LAEKFEQQQSATGGHRETEQQGYRALYRLRRKGRQTEHGEANVADAGVGQRNAQIALGEHADGTVNQGQRTEAGEQPVQIKRCIRR